MHEVVEAAMHKGRLRGVDTDTYILYQSPDSHDKPTISVQILLVEIAPFISHIIGSRLYIKHALHFGHGFTYIICNLLLFLLF